MLVPVCNAAMPSRAITETPTENDSMPARTMIKTMIADTNGLRIFSSLLSRWDANMGRAPAAASLLPQVVLLIGVVSTYFDLRKYRRKTQAAAMNRTANLPCG